jgi:hypothetical protein
MLMDVTMMRIDNARTALNNSQTEWAQLYWEGVLKYMLRLGNRIT